MIDHHFGCGSLLLDSQVVRTFIIAVMEDAVVLVFLLRPEQELGGSQVQLLCDVFSVSAVCRRILVQILP